MEIKSAEGSRTQFLLSVGETDILRAVYREKIRALADVGNLTAADMFEADAASWPADKGISFTTQDITGLTGEIENFIANTNDMAAEMARQSHTPGFADEYTARRLYLGFAAKKLLDELVSKTAEYEAGKRDLQPQDFKQ